MNKLTYNVHKINNDETQVKTTDQIKKNSSHTLLSIGYGQIKYRCLLEKKTIELGKSTNSSTTDNRRMTKISDHTSP